MKLIQSFIVLSVFIFGIGYVRCQYSDMDGVQMQTAELMRKWQTEFEEECRKNGAAYIGSLNDFQTEMTKCVRQKVSNTLRHEHITEEMAASTRAMLGLYCKCEPGIFECLEQFVNHMKPCMNNTVREATEKVIEISSNALKYLCYREGDRVATLLEEGGQKCIMDRKYDIAIKCNRLEDINMRLSNERRAPGSLPSLSFVSEQDCKTFRYMRTCVNEELTQCDESAPAKIVDDFVKFLEEQFTCIPSSSSAVTWNFLLLLVAALLLLFRS